MSNGKATYDRKVDIWSIGVTFYFMLFNKYPWSPISDDDLNLQSKTKSGKNLVFPASSSTLNPKIKLLLQQMICYEPA